MRRACVLSLFVGLAIASFSVQVAAIDVRPTQSAYLRRLVSVFFTPDQAQDVSLLKASEMTLPRSVEQLSTQERRMVGLMVFLVTGLCLLLGYLCISTLFL